MHQICYVYKWKSCTNLEFHYVASILYDRGNYFDDFQMVPDFNYFHWQRQVEGSPSYEESQHLLTILQLGLAVDSCQCGKKSISSFVWFLCHFILNTYFSLMFFSLRWLLKLLRLAPNQLIHWPSLLVLIRHPFTPYVIPATSPVSVVSGGSLWKLDKVDHLLWAFTSKHREN